MALVGCPANSRGFNLRTLRYHLVGVGSKGGRLCPQGKFECDRRASSLLCNPRERSAVRRRRWLDSPDRDVNNSLVLSNGLIRIGLTVPPNTFSSAAPQYSIATVQDPYGCALTTDASDEQIVSVYRRPLPATNLGFLSAVMFDGRESFSKPLNNEQTFALTPQQKQDLVNFLQTL